LSLIQNSFAYQLTAEALPFFEAYFGIQFGLPKIDMVAVPDFGFSGMEVNGVINVIRLCEFTVLLS
jgi:aminopeptidase N